ncbi:hypothetical protein ABAC460_22110 [Asticcacaulis sp. AC460]|uniref:tryptophan halogenase family protein n=1 Tax=Asticcacaulis sp. AC460 TaxID=1282360 RepID=UPI0003C406AE|nr:tryptophan halogenase family protein [Asticcacaulis sp. AC460]ESQ86747.1 hypothetical protein ABAC460_22110 [Asticcacaulis sp. AC460]
MLKSPIRKVVIVGRDEALWLAANVLWNSFRRTGLEIVAVELPSQLRPADVIPTLRNQQAFHDLMRIKEAPLMAATQATFSLGQRFIGFSESRPPFLHAYGDSGWAINRVAFHHQWVRARAKGLDVPYDDFSLNAMAALQGRFFVPAGDTEGQECDYGYHFDASAYCQVLKQVILESGIGHVAAARLNDVSRDPDSGDITAITLPDGQTVTGDLFVDATGAESLLLGAAMGVPFQSWAQWFPCDRILTTRAAPIKAMPAFSQVTAHHAGWVAQFPLRNRTAVQQVYAGSQMTQQDALDTAARMAATEFAEPVVRSFTAGRRQAAWSHNCVAIGEAAAVFDPIDSCSIQVILTGLSHLTSLLPLDRDMAPEAREYNLNVLTSLERIRDYQICHYKLNQRQGEPFWDRCRAMAVPDSLAYKLRLFEARGHLVEYDDETFLDYDWRAMLIGHGLIPRAYDIVADHLPENELAERLQKMLGFIKTRVQAMKPMDAHFT